MSHQIVTSFHGGNKDKNWNNLHQFDPVNGKKGNPSKLLNKDSLPDGISIREVRDFHFGPDGNLYVVNAYKDDSKILRFNGTPNQDGQYDFDCIFITYDTQKNPAFIHPFQFVFDVEGNLLVSLQDSNSVLRFYGPLSDDGQSGKPMPIASAYQEICQNCPPGTFIPSYTHYPSSGGLHSVRGIGFDSQGDFYVADIIDDRINVYDGKTGAFKKILLDKSVYYEINAPDHLLFSGNQLYIGNKGDNTILLVEDLTNPTVSIFIDNKKINAPSGMCFAEIAEKKKFILGSRKGYSILQFRIEDGQGKYEKVIVDDLEDQPEFVRFF